MHNALKEGGDFWRESQRKQRKQRKVRVNKELTVEEEEGDQVAMMVEALGFRKQVSGNRFQETGVRKQVSGNTAKKNEM
jgi:hypothetical protein